MIFKFLTIAVFIFLLFRFLFFIKNKIALTNNFKRSLIVLLPIFELLCWLGLLLLIISEAYYSKNNLALISISLLMVLLIIPSITLLRDFIVGLTLKFQNKINEGNLIELEGIKGTIRKAGHFRLDIVDTQGDINSISYNTIRSKVLKLQGNNQNLKKVQLLFSFGADEKVNAIIQELKIQILNTPWVAISQSLIIEEVKMENGKLNITVGAFALHESFAENIKEMVEQYFKLKYKD